MADAPKSNATTNNPVFTVLKQLKELWDSQPKGRRTLAVLVLVGVIGFVGVTTFLHKTESFTAVAEGLSPSDTTNVYTALMERGLNARLRDGMVEVEDGDLAQARAIAAVSASTAGLSSMSEQFGGNHIGRTGGEEQIAYKVALEGELARSIIGLSQVSSARVHIAFGKKSPIKDMESPATAAVTLMTRPGQILTADQVSGIRALIAAAVDNLDAKKVAVIGPRGPLDGIDEKSTGNNKQGLEEQIAERTRMMLEKMVGIGHVSVVATAEMDTRKIESTEDVYDKDGSVPLSKSVTIDGNDPTGGQTTTSGVAGTQGNLAGGPTPTTGAGTGSGNGHKQETTNFNNSHKQTHTENPEQTIKKLHVAVLVDEAKDKDGKSIARKPEELAKITTLTRQTAGIDDARGDTLEVASVAFAPIEVPEEPPVAKPLLPVPVPVAAGGAVGVLVLLVVVVMLLKRKKKSKTQALVLKGGNRLSFPTPVAELERVLDNQPALASKQTHSLPEGRTAQERVMDVVRGDVERAAGVLTGWLAEAPVAAKGAAK